MIRDLWESAWISSDRLIPDSEFPAAAQVLVNRVNISRVLVFKRGASGTLPIIETKEQVFPAVTLAAASEAEVQGGRERFNVYCSVCHGGNAMSGGIVPDLRYRISDLDDAWQSIVYQGTLAANGMAAWKEFLTKAEVDQVKAYVAHEARLGHQGGERRRVRGH